MCLSFWQGNLPKKRLLSVERAASVVIDKRDWIGLFRCEKLDHEKKKRVLQGLYNRTGRIDRRDH